MNAEKKARDNAMKTVLSICETAYLNDRKQLPLDPIAEGPDEQDFYFCPTCYAIVGVHDEDAIEHSGYCPDCGQKLSWRNYHEKRMKNRIKHLMQDGILTAEKKEGMLFCCLPKEISFVAPMPAIYDDEHIVDSISMVLSHPGSFGIFKDTVNDHHLIPRIRMGLAKAD